MIATLKVASRASFPVQILSWALLLVLLACMTASVPTPACAQEDDAESSEEVEEGSTDGDDSDESGVTDEEESGEGSENSDEEPDDAESDEVDEEDSEASESDDEEDESEEPVDDENEEGEEFAEDDEESEAITGTKKTPRNALTEATKTRKIVPRRTQPAGDAKKRRTAQQRTGAKARERREQRRLKSREAAKKRTIADRKAAAAKKNADTETAKKRAEALKKKAAAEEAKKAEAESLVGWLKENSLVALGVVWGGFLMIAGGVVLMILRRRGRREEIGHEIDLPEYEASEAKTEEVDVNDKNYALVVDEEELELPPTPEEKRKSAEMRRIHKARVHQEEIERLIDRRSFDRAFERYCEHLDGDEADDPLRPDREMALGRHFLSQGDLDKASRIFEHYIDSQPNSELQAEVFFDLGYIHFKTNTLGKSRECFERFADRETKPERVDRARELVKRLKKAQNLN